MTLIQINYFAFGFMAVTNKMQVLGISKLVWIYTVNIRIYALCMVAGIV